ncbi:hypothetical protein ACJMK2_014181 [Sinanodonta woodiana]|uniref:Uncharacterized protein n=1 Tax=Sinanodonta woodiana TaxID=1069815 RepID=A0ABD3UZU6_SINWO
MQTEVEGAKASIKQLEKRVLKIGQDVSSIDRNIKELMKMVSSSSPRYSPEETMPSTPYTPISRPVFSFDPSCGEDALSVGRMLKCDQCSYSNAPSFQSVNEISNKSQGSLLLGTSRKQDVNENILSPRKPPDIRLNKSSDALLTLGGNKSLKPHEPLIRRHSDGPVERKQTAPGRDPFEVQNEQESKQQSSCVVAAPYHEMKTLGQEFIVGGDDAEKPIRLSEIHSNGCIGNMSSVNHPTFHNRAETTFETGGGTETIEIITSPQSVTHVHKRLDGMILRTTDL